MKYLIPSVAALLMLISCSSPTAKTGTTDTVVAGDTLAKGKTTATNNNTPTVSSLCFLHTEGTKNQDSTSIELVIQGDKVTGQMNWLPYEKDSRKGKLDGTVKDSVIDAKWTFMQEGMTDTLDLNFKLTNNTLLQKPLKLNAGTDRQQTDQSAGYTIIYRTAEKLHR